MKEKLKSLLTLMMTLVMILSVGFGSSRALAEHGTGTADNGQITLTGTTSGKKYSVYKIFNLTFTESGSDKKVSYTIADEWKDFFNSGKGSKYIVDQKTDKLNPIVVDGKVKYININDSNIADFAKTAMGELSSKAKTKTETAKGESVIFSELPLGYYLVYPEGATEALQEQSSIVSLTSTVPSSNINVKGTYPTVDKKVDKQTADIGEELTYTLTSKVPDTTGYREYTFKMTDTLSDGLDFISSKEKVEVRINNQMVTEHITKTINGKNLVVSFDMLNLQQYVGKEIKVTYKAKLNKNAIITDGDNSNTVTLDYSNDPKDSSKTDTTKKEEKVFTAKIIVNKVDGKDQTALAGAKFKLKKKLAGVDKYYKVDPATKEVTWVDKNDATEVKTVIGTEGKATASFEGLAAGKYYLVETEAPQGYNLLTTEIEVEIKKTEDKGVVTAISNGEAKVENNSGIELPGTGGTGTKLFAAFGGSVILIALYSLAKGKIKKERN